MSLLVKITFLVVLIHVSECWIKPPSHYQHWNKLGATGHPYGRCLIEGKIRPCRFNPGPNKIRPTVRKPWPGKTTKKPGGGTTDGSGTATPKTTTPDPESEATKQIRERYRIARQLSAENLFALTEEEADQFTTRIFDEVEIDIPACNRTFPPFTDCKVRELASIFQQNQCVLTNVTTATPTPPPANNQPQAPAAAAAPTQNRRRKRRETGPMQTINNADGSVSRVMRCEERRTVSKNNLFRLCRTCYVQTTLPEGRFPRFLNEVTCSYIPPNTRTQFVNMADANSNSNLQQVDRLCLTGSGNCIEGTVAIQFLRDENNAGPNRLENWESYPQRIRSSCTCQMFRTSVLRLFV